MESYNSQCWGLDLCPEGIDRGFSLPTCVSQLDPVLFLCLEFSRRSKQPQCFSTQATPENDLEG